MVAVVVVVVVVGGGRRLFYVTMSIDAHIMRLYVLCEYVQRCEDTVSVELRGMY